MAIGGTGATRLPSAPLEYDQVHQMQEKKIRETQKKCKYGEKNGHEKSPSLERLV